MSIATTPSKVRELSDKEKLGGALVLALVGSLMARAYRYGFDVMEIIFILEQIGLANPPSWLVWSIYGAFAISTIVGILSGVGLVSVPFWALRALATADSIGM